MKKLKKKSVSTYFPERCVGGTKSDNIRKRVKPYLFKKNTPVVLARLFLLKIVT